MKATVCAIVTLVAAVAAYCYSSTVIEVPKPPMPGSSVEMRTDSQYINFATNFAQLIGTYSHLNAPPQFKHANRYFWGTEQHVQTLADALSAAVDTAHDQIFRPNLDKVRVFHFPELDRTEVRIPGMISRTPPGKESCNTAELKLTMTSIPRNILDESGIVVTDFLWSCL